MPDARFLVRFAPVAMGAALGVAVLGGVSAPVLDDTAPTASADRDFVGFEDELPTSTTATSAPTVDPTATTAPPPADVASLLVDLSPRGFTAAPPSAPFGPLPDAESAASMDAADDGGQPSVEALAGLLRLAGFTRGHATVWANGGDVVVATAVLEFEDGEGAGRFGGALAEIVMSDPLFTAADPGIEGAHAATARVPDEGAPVELFQAQAVRGARLYRVLVIDTAGNPVDTELGRALLAEQAAVG